MCLCRVIYISLTFFFFFFFNSRFSMNGKVNEKFLSPIHRSFDNPVFASDDEKITQSPQSAIGNLFGIF